MAVLTAALSQSPSPLSFEPLSVVLFGSVLVSVRYGSSRGSIRSSPRASVREDARVGRRNCLRIQKVKIDESFSQRCCSGSSAASGRPRPSSSASCRGQLGFPGFFDPRKPVFKKIKPEQSQNPSAAAPLRGDGHSAAVPGGFSTEILLFIFSKRLSTANSSRHKTRQNGSSA